MRRRLAEPLPGFMAWETVPALVGSRTTESLVAYPTTDEACRETIAFCRRNKLAICPRGSGHSYGDLPLNDGHLLLSTTKMDRILDFDEDSGRMVVEPGVQILDIYRKVHHDGWALPACPTESTITVAGAISANVNGKDSWRVGNFGDQVLHLELRTASGELRSIDREADRELFRAVVGGLGLLGVIVKATIQLVRVPSPYLQIARFPVRDLDALLDRLRRFEETSDFAVVWLDISARGNRLGRGVIHATKWEHRDATPQQRRAEVGAGLDRLAARRRQALAMYGLVSSFLSALLQAQRLSVNFFNRLYYVYSKLRRSLGLADNAELFLRYNFDTSYTVPPAATVCGPRGYTIQVTVAREHARSALPEMIELLQKSPCPPVTTIMRIHRRDDHLISFCEDGYSLNFEIHPKERHEERMQRVVESFMDCVIRYGGKVHLAKDMVLNAEQFRRIYPGHAAFLEIKRRLDPDGLFESDLYRRLLRAADDAPTPPAGREASIPEEPEIHVAPLAGQRQATD